MIAKFSIGLVLLAALAAGTIGWSSSSKSPVANTGCCSSKLATCNGKVSCCDGCPDCSCEKECCDNCAQGCECKCAAQEGDAIRPVFVE
jgi:hypothetical protein